MADYARQGARRRALSIATSPRVYFRLRSRLLGALEAGSITVEQLLTSSDDELLERIGVGAADDLAQELLAD
jgi:hypothetical protein